MRFRASVGAIGLALSVAAPVYAQSAGAIEIGGFGRMQFHDKQLLIPDVVSPASDEFTRKYGYGFGGRLGVFFAENWSVEGGYHFVRQPAIRNTNLTLRALWNRSITEKLGYHVGAGVLMNSYTLAPFTGAVGSTAPSAIQYYAGSDGVSDFGIAGLIGTRWKFTDMIALRIDGTASMIPSPSTRRDEFTRLNCGAPGTPTCVRAQDPEGMDLNLGLEAGVSVLLNNGKDTDGDGVKDKGDTCPNTPKDVKVDAKGCPVDTDSDKIADYLDKCPNTPKGVAVDANGCPVDSDGDKIADYLDKCPNTPRGAAVDNNGCPVDTDKDGVADYMDKCPNTPAGVKVDAAGCPVDTDMDGVADYLDKCPNSGRGVKVDANGCSLDNDADGVNDTADKCPNTPAGVQVDNTGCPLDGDKDGVADYLDKCPNTKAGTAVDARGCPRLFEEGKAALTLTGVNFATGTARLTPASRPALDKVAEGLAANADVKVEVSGHTDNRGNARANLRLSQQRAAAVRAYLLTKGVKAEQVTAVGFGGTQPIGDNKTNAGRTANRRVEMKKIN
jgi:outer membrane protein OmpA-like peptidoglycan-associated protein/sulfur carrier protein ThiS